jgi:hypothetical protein
MLPVSASLACALVWDMGVVGRVALAKEEAIIVWDAAAGMQHFIRRASFHTKAADFGFLVPTPTRPELSEASGDPFKRLSDAVRPKVQNKYDYRFYWTLIGSLRRTTVQGIFTNVDTVLDPMGVRVLETKRIAGYDASVLRADDSRALLQWLNDHDYNFRPEMADWLKPYTDAGWIVTAFKYSQQSGGAGNSVGSQAVRMSFKTDRPFFPYREPVDPGKKAGSKRSLRVFLVSDARMRGVMEDVDTPWPGVIKYAKKHDDLATLLEGALSSDKLSKEMWLTAYEDSSSIRPGGGDLFFEASGETKPVIPPPKIRNAGTREVPLCLDAIAVVGILIGVRRLRRRHSVETDR